MREINKTTVQLINKVEYLNQSSATQLDFVSPKLNDFFNHPSSSADPSSAEPAVAPVDYRAAQQSNIARLHEGCLEVQDNSQGHRVAKIETSNAIKERDFYGEEITGRFRGLRLSVKASYKERWRFLGLEAPPESEYMGIYERCRDLYGYLIDPQLPIRIGEPEDGQPALDFAQLASVLKPRLDLYKESIDRWVAAKKRRDDALIAKRASIKRLRSLYANIARIQEGYFRLAGLEELADRIRMTIPKSRKQNPDQNLEQNPDSSAVVSL